MNSKPTSAVLLLYIEPTGYIAAQIAALRTAWKDRIEPVFITEDASQNWQIDLADLGATRLPASRWAAAQYLWRHLTPKRYRLVHLAGWGHPLLMMALQIASWRGIPSTVESDTFDDRNASRAKRLVKRIIYPVLFRLPAYFLPGGQSQAEYLSRYGVRPSRRLIAQMTVDVEGIQAYIEKSGARARADLRSRHNIEPSAIVFLFVGRLENYKGIGDLLSAFASLNKSQPGAHLVIVGDGSMSLDVETAALECSAIHSLGRLNGNDLLNAYAGADVLVLASYFEPWGLVVNEAMAAGLPVVASNRVGCVADLIAGKNSGVVFEAGSVASLEAALRQFLIDGERKRAMSVAARRVISGWTMTVSAKRITSIWAEVLLA